MLSMDTASHTDEIFLVANLAPFDETVFVARGKYLPERDAFAVEDRPNNGLPSLGWITVNALGWLPV
jgi:hypothetical protein